MLGHSSDYSNDLFSHINSCILLCTDAHIYIYIYMYVYLYVCIDFSKIILMLLSFMRSSRAEDSMNLTVQAPSQGQGSTFVWGLRAR